MYCVRRGGSTWLANTLAANSGTRYVNRPFITALNTRHRRWIPDLAASAGRPHSDHNYRQFVQFSGSEEHRFRVFAGRLLRGEIEVYPSLNFNAPYFERRSDRIVFQMTSGGPMIAWFDHHFDVDTLILIRHPITNAFSVERLGWEPECLDFIENEQFIDLHMSGEQMDLARTIMEGRSMLAKHVLDWSLKMLVPIRSYNTGKHPSWTLVSYEQMVQQPSLVIDHIADRHRFDDRDAMIGAIKKPSRTASPGVANGANRLNGHGRSWRQKLSHSTDEHDLLMIPKAFGLQLYRTDHDLPGPSYLIDADQDRKCAQGLLEAG